MKAWSSLGSCLAPFVLVAHCAGEDVTCTELNKTVLDKAAAGQWVGVEEELSAAVNTGAQICTGVILNNLAAVMAVSSRPVEAENYAQRSIKILGENYGFDDPLLLRPLQILSAARLDQRKVARSREAFQRMLRIQVARPRDRALVHGMAASLLPVENRTKEAELVYLAALEAFRDGGLGDTADAAALLNGLAVGHTGIP